MTAEAWWLIALAVVSGLVQGFMIFALVYLLMRGRR